MAIPPIVLAIPLVMLFAGGGRRKRRASPWVLPTPDTGTGTESEMGPEGLPPSNRMIFTPDCSALAVRVTKWDYDIRITNYFWYLRGEGWDDPAAIAAAMLRADSPHCDWPPAPSAPEWAHTIWEGTYAAVKNYYDLEMSGELWEYAVDPLDPNVGAGVKPLVVWS